MTGDNAVNSAGMRFDTLYKALQPHIDEIGDHADLKFEEGKGLFAKEGLGKNWLSDLSIRIMRYFRGDDVERCSSFVNAASEIAKSINVQFPGAMVGDLTLGEYLVSSVAGSVDGEYRLNRSSLKEVNEALSEYRDRMELDPAEGNSQALSNMGGSKNAQTLSSVEAGKQLMMAAVEADLEWNHERRDSLTRTYSATSTWSSLTDGELEAARQYVDMSQGLCLSSLEQFRLSLHRLGYDDHPSLDRLFGMLDLRRNIDVSRQRCAELNMKVSGALNGLSKEDAGALGRIIDDRREIIEGLRNLPFPLLQGETALRRDYYLRLQDNAVQVLKLAEGVEAERYALEEPETTQEARELTSKQAAFDILKEQAMETLGLAASIRPYDYDEGLFQQTDGLEAVNLVNALNDGEYFDLKELEALSGSVNAMRLTGPKTIYEANNGTPRQLDLSGARSDAFNQVEQSLEAFLSDQGNAEKRWLLAETLVRATSLIERTIENAERHKLMFGDSKFQSVSDDIESFYKQRETLNQIKLNLLFAEDLPGVGQQRRYSTSVSQQSWMENGADGVYPPYTDYIGDQGVASDDDENRSILTSEDDLDYRHRSRSDTGFSIEESFEDRNRRMRSETITSESIESIDSQVRIGRDWRFGKTTRR